MADHVIVNSPSRRGQTCRINYTSECRVAVDTSSTRTETQSHPVPEPSQTEIKSRVTRAFLDHPRLIRPSITIPSRIEPEWVMVLERSVEYENMFADAALIMAEAARAQAAAAAAQATAAAAQADVMRTLVELMRSQQDDFRALLDLTRKQASMLPDRDH